tara:strand:+ start:318 stop:653 length:336 start_codon:yes stop_codon:yes gene_type:complete
MSQQKIKNLENQKKYAWGKYFGEVKEHHQSVCELVEKLDELKSNENINHIINELRDLYKKYLVEVECPICLEIIKDENLEFSSCFHKYCKNCLNELKKTSDKCAVCRKKFR